jgi:hypothetical protein
MIGPGDPEIGEASRSVESNQDVIRADVPVQDLERFAAVVRRRMNRFETREAVENDP